MFRVDAHKEVSDKVAEKGSKWLRSRHAGSMLALISFAESVIVPILIDPFLIALIFARRELWKRYIFISVAASVVGGIVGYVLGYLFFDTIGSRILDFFGLLEDFNVVADNFDTNGFVFVLIGAFTPIPYKLIAIASGVLTINFTTFLIASIVGRFLRLGLVGLAAYTVGPKALPIMQRNLHLFAAVTGVLLIAYILIKIF